MSYFLQILVFCMTSMPLFGALNIEDVLMRKEAHASVSIDLDEHLCTHLPYEKITWEGTSCFVTVITQENYPQAYAWYQKMKDKYPEADLDKYSFVVGAEGWAMMPAIFIESKRPLIGCPWNKLYGNFTPDDEASLLHEAGHAHNHENWSLLYKGGRDITNFTKLGIIAALAVGSSHAYNQDYFGLQKKLQYDPFAKEDLYGHLKGTATIVSAIAAPIVAYYVMKKGQVIAWRKLDERYADKFANKYADADALKGSIEFFDRLSRYEPKLKQLLKWLIKPNIYFEYYPGFTEKIQSMLDGYNNYFYKIKKINEYLCEEHPYSAIRANEARKSLKKRFGQEVEKKFYQELVLV